MARNFFSRITFRIPIIAILLSAPTTFAADSKACIEPAGSFGTAFPENQNANLQKLLGLTEWVKANPEPIFSILISKNGKIIYSLYTSAIPEDAAHYLMSATKSLTSLLVGIAIDHGFLKGTEQTIPQIFPNSEFENSNDVQRFKNITLKEVLGMSALDAPVAPHSKTPEAVARIGEFFKSQDRVKFALSQAILKNPGIDFQYTDVTPALATGAVAYSSKTSAFQFANRYLFEPLGFKNQEWMHEDSTGVDNGAFGIRLRPVDMQKLGVLLLNHGCWNQTQLISEKWVNTSFTPWIKSVSSLAAPDYGWYWWQYQYHGTWKANVANGWKGQRIAIFPKQNVVVTMTGNIGDGTEAQVFNQVINGFVIPAFEPPSSPNQDTEKLKTQLKVAIEQVHAGPSRITAGIEPRMIPSIQLKEGHRPFLGD